MEPKISAELMIATCRSVEELRSSGRGLPTEQADAILAALKYCGSIASDAPAEHREGNWGSLPDEIMKQVVRAAQEPTPKQPDDVVQGWSSGPGLIMRPWWRACLVCRSWNRAFSKHFKSWDMTLPCINYEVDEAPPRFRDIDFGFVKGPDGEASMKLCITPVYRITDRGLYGCYGKWLAERFPNLRRLSLPPFSRRLKRSPECDCPACSFISFSSGDHFGMTAILESLGAFKNLTSLEWNLCPMLEDEHLQAISDVLPQLECLVLGSDEDADCELVTTDLATVSDEGLLALAKLTSLGKLHIAIAEPAGLDRFPITSAGLASLTTLNQLTSLTCRCIMSPGDQAGEDLKRISRMVQLQELDLLGSGFHEDMDDGTVDEDFGEDEKMQDAYLTPLESLTDLCKLRLPVCPGWTRKGMENLLQKLPKVSDHNEWYYQRH